MNINLLDLILIAFATGIGNAAGKWALERYLQKPAEKAINKGLQHARKAREMVTKGLP